MDPQFDLTVCSLAIASSFILYPSSDANSMSRGVIFVMPAVNAPHRERMLYARDASIVSLCAVSMPSISKVGSAFA